MKIMYRPVITINIGICALTMLLYGCSNDSSTRENEDEADARIEASSNIAEVTVMELEPKMFTHEIVSNGKVGAGEYVDLRFATSGAVIADISVKNGQRVSKGQTIATLDKFKLENAERTAVNNLERARLDLADALIGQGYDPEKPQTIPDEVMRLARLRSGVAQAEVQLSEDRKALEEATLRAPFDGTIANLFQKAGNQPDGTQPFCRVIASSGMEIDFPVLESELPLIHHGDAVQVTPYTSDATYQGRISAINPIVEEDGMVKVRATVAGGHGLFTGMNVKISVKRELEKALVVPKSAVVLRSGGRPVIFTLENGTAKWNYVTTSLENMTEYVVTDGLTGGEKVIISGNLNLAHEAPVKVIGE